MLRPVSEPPEVVDLRDPAVSEHDDVYRAFAFAAKEVHNKRRHLLMTGTLAGSGVDLALALEDLETLFDSMTTEFPRTGGGDEKGPLWQAFEKESETGVGDD